MFDQQRIVGKVHIAEAFLLAASTIHSDSPKWNSMRTRNLWASLLVDLSSLSLTLCGPDERLVGLKFYHNRAHL